MFERYVIPESVEKKLVDAGLEARVKNADLPALSFISREAVLECIEDVRNRGYVVPGITFLLKSALKNKNAFWSLQTSQGEQHVEVEPEDFTVLSGYLAAQVIENEQASEFRDRLGFSSKRAFLTTLSAYAANKSTARGNHGFYWKAKEGDKEFKTWVSATMDGDLFVLRKDISSYPCVDPIGEPVPYRPEPISFEQMLAGAHSTEPSLLVHLMNYVVQQNVDSKILSQEGALAFLEKMGRLEQNIGAFAESLYPDRDPHFYRARLDHWKNNPIPQLGKNYSRHFVAGNSSYNYQVFIGESGNLVFRGMANDLFLKPALSVQAAEIDDFVTALFLQAKAGLGRTHASVLADLVAHRYLK